MAISLEYLPSLPMETHAHILSYCDAQTLGRASRVSLAFLELAGPLLYRHVTITGFNQLQRLLYTDELAVSTAFHLVPLLSLNQTHTFTFVGTPKDRYHSIHPTSSNASTHTFSAKHRVRSSTPIRVDTLVARFCPDEQDSVWAAAAVHGSFLALFSPTHAVLSSMTPPDPTVQDVARAALGNLGWDSLRSLSFSNLTWCRRLSRAPFLGRLPPRSLTLTLNVTEAWDSKVMHDALGHLVCDLTPRVDENDEPVEMLSPAWPQVEELVVKIASEALREKFLRQVHDEWDHVGRPSQEERDRRLAMIRFVVG